MGLGGNLSGIHEVRPCGPQHPLLHLANHPVSLLPKTLGPLMLLLFPIKTYFRPSLE